MNYYLVPVKDCHMSYPVQATSVKMASTIAAQKVGCVSGIQQVPYSEFIKARNWWS